MVEQSSQNQQEKLRDSSLRSKRSRRKRTKFWPRVLVFCILDERKMGQEQKDERKGVGERKEGKACPQTPRFWKTRSPTNGAPDWCGMVILINKSIKFVWMITVITRAWLAYVISESFFKNLSGAVYIIDRTRRSNRKKRTLATSLSSTESFFVSRWRKTELKKPAIACCVPCKSEFTRAGNFQTKDSDFRLVL